MYFFSLVTLQKARTHGLLAEVYRIIANDLRVWEGGGRWRTLGVDHKIFRGNKRGISRRQ